jgi:hypothetical protein
MSDKADKISDSVETCLALALGQRAPFSRVASYLQTLQAAKNWTAAEVIEVQARVIRALMKRIVAGE